MSSLRGIIPNWVKDPVRKVRQGYRQATSGSRPLPHFLIIGAQKAGTSSLYSYLEQHPQLVASYQKEVHYFDGGLDPAVDSYAKGSDWYRTHFPPKSAMSPNSLVFEASPLYFGNPSAPGRIHDLLPEARLILVLRNPVERAVSQYYMEFRKGRETLPIKEALQAEESRLAPIIAAGDFKNPVFMYHSYKLRGVYHQLLAKYLEFFPREQLLVLSSEWFFSEPEQALEKVFGFVGADTSFKVRDLKPRNVAKNKKKMDGEVREYLERYFEPHNQALCQMIGEDFGW